MVPCQGLSAGHAQLRAFPAAKHNPSFLRRSSLRTPAGSLSLKSSRLQSETKNFSARAVLARTDFLQHDMLTSFQRESSIKGIPSLFIWHNHQRQRSEVGCRASSLSSFSYPELTSKPRWWWRTLACVPYLLPLHNMWSYADVIYQLHTYLQGFSLVYTFIDTMTLFPGWLFLVIFMTVLLRRETKVVTALSEVPCDLGYPPGHWLPSSGNNVHLDAQHRVSGEAHAVFLDVYCFYTDLHSARVHAVCSCWDVSKCSFYISHGVYSF